MIYNGAAVREQLEGLRHALLAAKDRTELDPFDDALFNAISYMLEVSEAQTHVFETTLKSVKKIERRAR